jgi:hypothetical protein
MNLGIACIKEEPKVITSYGEEVDGMLATLNSLQLLVKEHGLSASIKEHLAMFEDLSVDLTSAHTCISSIESASEGVKKHMDDIIAEAIKLGYKADGSWYKKTKNDVSLSIKISNLKHTVKQIDAQFVKHVASKKEIVMQVAKIALKDLNNESKKDTPYTAEEISKMVTLVDIFYNGYVDKKNPEKLRCELGLKCQTQLAGGPTISVTSLDGVLGTSHELDW